MSTKKKVVFITGTRADYGKLKSIINKLNKNFNTFIYITGMHMLSKYGSTYIQVVNENQKSSKIKLFKNQTNKEEPASIIFARTVNDFTKYILRVEPDLLLVHGDRFEALAAAVSGCANNILVGHIEGGELSGNIDEHLRHAISKLSHVHFVSNKFAKRNLIQLGEKKESIYNVGSPDIDIMLSKNLPSLNVVKKKYSINFKKYCIAILHPTFFKDKKSFLRDIKIFINSLIKSEKNYLIIYPNNDYGSDLIIDNYKKFLFKKRNFKIMKSFRFEYFLTLLKNSDLILGNSSAALMEAPIYGIPAINIGNRQENRFFHISIKNTKFNEKEILGAIKKLENKKFKFTKHFGKGNSSKLISNILKKRNVWKISKQKQMVIQDI
ncbi:UDP-N-acetylglucosamine 2-epimerase [Candidatus Pelagibacter sp.]|nr:UDP-N-acetylglucosamine 2-epimerase [Candidatus Pelagibacter sp.]